MGKLQIIGAPASPFVCATRTAAFEKGVEFDTIAAPPHSPEVLAINPFGKIPVMRHGDVELSESSAIIAYIDAAFDGPPLAPRDVLGAARTAQWVSRFIAEMCPVMIWRYIAQYSFPRGANGQPDRAVIDEAAPLVDRHIGTIESALKQAPFLAGQSFTTADLYLLPLLHYLRQLPESGSAIKRSPALSAYIEREFARPSFKAATPPPITEENRKRALEILTATEVEPLRASA